MLAQAVKHLLVTGGLILLGALFGEVITPRVRIIPAVFVIIGAGFALVGWWNFARWVWQLLGGGHVR